MIAALSVAIRVLVRPEWAELTNMELTAGRISEVGGLSACGLCCRRTGQYSVGRQVADVVAVLGGGTYRANLILGLDKETYHGYYVSALVSFAVLRQCTSEMECSTSGNEGRGKRQMAKVTRA